MTDSRNRPPPWAKPALPDRACSHHVFLFDVAKGPHVFLNDGANGPRVATLDGAFSPPTSRMFPNIHKNIPVTSLEGCSAQEVKLSLSGITDIRENESLAEPKKQAHIFLTPGTYLGGFVNNGRLQTQVTHREYDAGTGN